MEKTKFVKKAEVETAFVLPKTLQAETQLMPMGEAKVPMYAVYGQTDEETPRRVWCATFVDSDEAMAWVMASKTFGKAVRGAVISKQTGVTDGAREDGGAAAQKPN